MAERGRRFRNGRTPTRRSGVGGENLGANGGPHVSDCDRTMEGRNVQLVNKIGGQSAPRSVSQFGNECEGMVKNAETSRRTVNNDA